MMKIKYSNFLALCTVLFVMLAQSVDGFEHLIGNMHVKECLHKHYSEDYFTHYHQEHSQCFVCDFSFSTLLILHDDVVSSNIVILSNGLSNGFYISQQLYFYIGANRQLRGPPKFIV